MDRALIDTKIDEIIALLEQEVMEILANETLDRRDTNLRMKPLSSTKKILMNAKESIKMVDELAQKELKGDQ
jgi:hypothetical protein